MARGGSIRISTTPSMGQLISKLAELGPGVRDEAQQTIMRAAYAIEADAKGRVPRNNSRLATSIVTQRIQGEIGAEVGTDVQYGKWQEFGTARVGSQTIGAGMDGVTVEDYSYGTKHPIHSRHLQSWVKDKGIGTEIGTSRMAFLIARSIRRKGGIPARPYLVPAFKIHKPRLERDLRILLSRRLNR